MENTNELIVLKCDDCEELTLALRSWFSETTLGECYGRYGQILGGDAEDEDEIVEAHHYWDGHNWCSIIIRPHGGEWQILDEEDAEPVLEAWEEADMPSQFKNGCRATVANGYEFSQCLYEWDWGIASVREV